MKEVLVLQQKEIAGIKTQPRLISAVFGTTVILLGDIQGIGPHSLGIDAVIGRVSPEGAGGDGHW